VNGSAQAAASAPSPPVLVRAFAALIGGIDLFVELGHHIRQLGLEALTSLQQFLKLLVLAIPAAFRSSAHL
jgi:hypothetical protein